MPRKDLQAIKMRFGIIGNDEQLMRDIDVAIQVAPTDLSVLITGESGVGKESFPQIIHQFSRRKHGQYIAVNCGAIPKGTIASELFGHEKGAFTGAISDRKGYFAEANGGTIFLDEVGELPLEIQVQLLRILESGEYIKVGSSKVEKTDVRIVAATNLNLQEAISEGRFREDLYYRLNTIPIKVPALRERGDDIVLLFRKFAADFAEKYQMPAIRLTEEAKITLKTYPWPGNVRQLKNVTEQTSIVESNREITPDILKKYLPESPIQSGLPMLLGADQQNQSFASERELLYKILFDMRKDVNDLKDLVNHLKVGSTPHTQIYPNPVEEKQFTSSYKPDAIIPPVTTYSPHNVKEPTMDIPELEEYVEESPRSLDEMKRKMIIEALNRHHGKRKLAAKDLHISERTLYRKIKEYGLDKEID